MVFVPPLAVEKWRNWGVLLTLLRNLQMRGAFIAAFTSEKRWMTIKKSLLRNWPLIANFFIAHLSILVRCKTKGAVGAVCTLLGIWPLCAQLPITVWDGPESLQGSHRMGDGLIFLSLMKTYRMSLISARSISLDSTFNVDYAWKLSNYRTLNIFSFFLAKKLCWKF